jgi:hypothetical protein
MGLGQSAGNEQVRMVRHQRCHRLTCQTNKGLVHKEKGIPVASQQIRQRLHIIDSTIGIVRVDDNHKRRSPRYFQLREVKCKVFFGQQPGFGITLRNLGE